MRWTRAWPVHDHHSVEARRCQPVDTGRMASSWFIGKGNPSREVAPERDGPGPVKVTLQRADHHEVRLWIKLLPYAERVALDPLWAGGAGWGPYSERPVQGR